MEGSVRAATFAELASRHGMDLPEYQDPAELYYFADIPAFFETYKKVCHSARDRDDFRRIAYEVLEDASVCGVRYMEMFWSPTEHFEVGVPFQVQLDGITDGIREAESDFGIQCRAIAAINREREPEAGTELAQMMVENRNDYLIGIGLDFDELDNPPEKFWKAYRIAKEAGFHRTAHACERIRPPRDIETCLDLLGCERIDHGYRVILDEAIARRCADEGIVFTVIPLYQPMLMALVPDVGEGYPIQRMIDMGLRVMLDADDPTMGNSDAVTPYTLAAEQMGLGAADFKELVLNGIDGSWLDDSTKRQWRREWGKEIDEMIAALDN